MLKLDIITTQQIVAGKLPESKVGGVEFYKSSHGIVMKNQFGEFFLVSPEERDTFMANYNNPQRRTRILG